MKKWDECKKILCVRLDSIGDVLMTTPALRALKETVPDRELVLLTGSVAGQVAPLVPAIDRCLVYDAPWIKATAPRMTQVEDFVMIRRLREEQFDAAVIFTVFSQNPMASALLCYLAGIPLRLAHCRENPYQLLTDWVKDPEPETGIRHEVKRQLDLVAAIGCSTFDQRLSLKVPAASEISVARLLREKEINTSERLVVIHPGASAPSRRYDPHKFRSVASALVSDLSCQIVFTGQDNERALIEGIQNDLDVPSESFIGTLELAEIAALIGRADVLVTNNTGPAHIAAAVGTPVVDLYALTNPQHTPWQVPNRVLFHDVPCKFCFKSICPAGHHHCLELVAWQDVVKAVEELLEAKIST